MRVRSSWHNLDIAVFDQARAKLNPETTLWGNLTTD
jgi:ATP-binding cassette subfamily F protein uup